MLYNSAFKELYFSSKKLTGSRAKNIRNLFEHIGDVETLLDKDLGTFSIDEFYITISYLSTMNITVARDRMTVIEDYMAFFWKQNNISREVIHQYMLYFRIQNASSNHAIKSTMLGSSEDVANMLEFSLSPVEENRPSNVVRIITWLLFMGVPKTEILNIKKADVDLNNNELVCNGKKYKIDSYAIPVFHKVCTTNSFVRPLFGVESEVSSKQPELLTGTTSTRSKNDEVTLINSMSALNRFNDKAGIKTQYSADRIARSGEFYRLYLLEKHGGSPIEAINKKFSERGFTDYDLRDRVRLENLNYTNWKSVFHGEEET